MGPRDAGWGPGLAHGFSGYDRAVPRRTLVATLLATAVVTATAGAATPPPTETPQDAVTAIKKILKRTMADCATDWAKIHAVGYEGSWTIKVTIRESKAGEGTAHWFIGNGWPRAKNALAKALAHGCPEP